MHTDLTLYRGDTERIRLTLTDPDGVPVDLTGATLSFTAKERIGDEDDVAPLAVDVVDHPEAALGIGEIELAAEATATLTPGARYQYDIQLTTAAGDVATLVSGRLKVLADVTRRRLP